MRIGDKGTGDGGGGGDAREAHLWICRSKPIVGPTSSNRGTENRKPTVSWVEGRREGKDEHEMGQRGQLQRERQRKQDTSVNQRQRGDQVVQ